MNKKTVFCALSGGVDSSVAAARLLASGFRVVGIFMKNWSDASSECPWEEDYRDVRRVCAKLDIPYYTWNFEEEYRAYVLSDFLREYQAGRTPNPDVLCNEKIKFGVFLKRALNSGADYIATGHYARVKLDKQGIYHLLRGVDSNKDQSYFLYRLGQSELSKILFPVGDLTKTQVRKLAREYGLPTADKKDSQGICFIGKLNVKEYLQDQIKTEQGEVVLQNGAVVGYHRGIELYTIGERAPVGGPGPFFVVDKNEQKNQLIVTTDEHDPLLSHSLCRVARETFVSSRIPFAVEAQPRYRAHASKAELVLKDRVWETRFERPEKALTPGQSMVWYEGERVVGGGMIDTVAL